MKDIKRPIKSITIGAAFSKIDLLILLLNNLANNRLKYELKPYHYEKAEARLSKCFRELNATNKIEMFDCFNHLFQHITGKEYALKNDLEIEEISDALKNYLLKVERLAYEERIKGL